MDFEIPKMFARICIIQPDGLIQMTGCPNEASFIEALVNANVNNMRGTKKVFRTIDDGDGDVTTVWLTVEKTVKDKEE